jgi:hypothetical protein
VDELKPSSSKVRLDTELLLKGKLQQVASKEWIMYKPRGEPFTRLHLKSICAIFIQIQLLSVDATFLIVLELQFMRLVREIFALFN